MKHPIKFFSIDARINVMLIERSGGYGTLIVESGGLSWSCHFDGLGMPFHEFLAGMDAALMAERLIEARVKRKLAHELQKLTAITRNVIETLNLTPV